MRTTIEISPEHRARLLELAARRGQKGFSALIEEALELYLTQDAARAARARRALALRGTLTSRDAAQLRAASDSWREHWR
jgi:predicted transcriptional regulator